MRRFRYVLILMFATELLTPANGKQVNLSAKEIIGRSNNSDALRVREEIEKSPLNATLIAESPHLGSVVRSIAYSPDGGQIASVTVDGAVQILNAKTGDLISSFSDREFAQYGVAYRSDGKQFVTCGDKGARIWEAGTNAAIATLTGHMMLVEAVAFSPDGSRIATGSSDHTARIYDARSGKSLLTFSGHGFFVRSIAFAPNGKYVATGSDDKTARIWDAKTGKLISTLSGHGGGIHSVAFSPDGARLVTGSMDHTARVWNATTGDALSTLSAPPLDVIATFSPTAQSVATGSGSDIIRIWDAFTGQRLASFYRGHSDVYSIAYSPDGEMLATGTWDDYVQIWKIPPERQAPEPEKTRN